MAGYPQARAAAAGLLLLAATPATAAPPAATDPAAAVVWAARPTAAQVTAAYPKQALADRLPGRATLACDVAADGALAGCAVTAEDPPGQGFGPAALSLAAAMRLEPGHPATGERLNLPIRFTPPEPDAPPRPVRFARHIAEYDHIGPAGPFYPDQAQRARLDGAAVIACKVAAAGALTDCVKVAEAPVGQFFADAALAMARKGWILAAPRADGKPEPADPQRFAVPFVLRRER